MLDRTGQEILKIKTPECLFSPDPDQAKREFLLLAKKWHPDKNAERDSQQVFEHVNDLFEKAKEKLSKGVWELPNTLILKDTKGKSYSIKYKKKHSFALGTMYIGDTLVSFELPVKHKSYYDKYLTTIRNFPFANDRMKQEAERYLPKLKEKIETKDNLYIVLEKTEDLLLLRDVFTYFHNKMPIKHMAWVQSTLQNLLCYFQYAKIAHNDISLDNYFISPRHHSGALLGGWWFSARYNEKLTTVPTRTFSLMHPGMRSSKKADGALDSELIRAVGRELLGDKAGVNLTKDSSIPVKISSFLLSIAAKDHIDDYSTWRKALSESFDKRYEKLELTSTDLYGL